MIAEAVCPRSQRLDRLERLDALPPPPPPELGRELRLRLRGPDGTFATGVFDGCSTVADFLADALSLLGVGLSQIGQVELLVGFPMLRVCSDQDDTPIDAIVNSGDLLILRSRWCHGSPPRCTFQRDHHRGQQVADAPVKRTIQRDHQGEQATDAPVPPPPEGDDNGALGVVPIPCPRQCLVVLDLDGTLLDAAPRHRRQPPALYATPDFASNCGAEVRFRPGLACFLREVRQHYDLAVWTAAPATYASEMIAGIERMLGKESGFTADSLVAVLTEVETEVAWRGVPIVTKDLRKVGALADYPMWRTLVVDDTPSTYRLNPANALPVPSWSGMRASKM